MVMNIESLYYIIIYTARQSRGPAPPTVEEEWLSREAKITINWAFITTDFSLPHLIIRQVLTFIFIIIVNMTNYTLFCIFKIYESTLISTLH